MKVSSIDKLHKLTTTKVNTSINHAMSNSPIVEMKNFKVRQGKHNNAFDLDLIKITTVIASAVTTANSLTTLHISSFTSFDIKLSIHSIITQLAYTTYFLPLLTFSQSFVRLSNARQNPTIDATLYTELSKTIANLSFKILSPQSTSKNFYKQISRCLNHHMM